MQAGTRSSTRCVRRLSSPEGLRPVEIARAEELPCGNFTAVANAAFASAGGPGGFASGTFTDSSFKVDHPVSELDTPEIQVRRDQLHS